MKIIGERIRSLRESVSLSQMKMAKTFGLAQSSVFRYETGETMVPPEVLLRYADYFDVSMDYIYGRTDNPMAHHMRANRRSKKAIRRWTGSLRCASTPALP